MYFFVSYVGSGHKGPFRLKYVKGRTRSAVINCKARAAGS
jgi:hypothetical protein